MANEIKNLIVSKVLSNKILNLYSLYKFMVLTLEQLENLVNQYTPIVRYTIGENENHIIFHLENEKEISISLKTNNENFEGLGQLRERNQRGFGEASSIIKDSSEIEVAEKIIENLLDFNLQRKNR